MKGFTLLELIIAMSITAMLLTGMTLGTKIVLREWSREGNVLDSELDSAMVLLQIERALQGAYPHLYQEETTDKAFKKNIYFVGTENEIRWVSTVTPGRSQGMAAWRLSADDDGLRLFYAPALAGNPDQRLDDRQGDESGESLALLAGWRMAVQYLDEQQDVPGGKVEQVWLPEWSGEERNSLPGGVWITLLPVDLQQGEGLPQQIICRIGANEHETIRPKRP